MNPLQASAFINTNPYFLLEENPVEVLEKEQSEKKKAPQIDYSAIKDPALKKALESIRSVPLVRNPDTEKRSKENADREIAIVSQKIKSLKDTEINREICIKITSCVLCPITSPIICACYTAYRCVPCEGLLQSVHFLAFWRS